MNIKLSLISTSRHCNIITSKRPYTLVPLTATQVPVPYFLDRRGERLAADAPIAQIAWSVYDIEIQRGIQYQPHPALATDAAGRYLYHDLRADDLHDIYRLADFARTGSRELTAADYVYQIKRLAHPQINSPILGIMSQYIDGLAEYAETLKKNTTSALPRYRCPTVAGFAPLCARWRQGDWALSLSDPHQGQISAV